MASNELKSGRWRRHDLDVIELVQLLQGQLRRLHVGRFDAQLGGAYVSLHGADHDEVRVLSGLPQPLTQLARLLLADVGQLVVILGAEAGLAMAYQQGAAHAHSPERAISRRQR